MNLKVAGSTNWTYPLADHLGTSTVTDSFGNGSPGFTGRENDNFSGLMYYRARMYDPQLGRFISEDPIGFEGGDVNLYGYVRNNPPNWKDPYGLDLFGLSGSATIFAGLPGPSGGGTAGGLVGYGSDGVGFAGSYGYFYGPGRTPADTSNAAGWAAGGGGGIGGGVFWTNADKWCELGGDFETTIVGGGPFGSAQIDWAENGVVVIQYSPSFAGKGALFGITHFRTTTPYTGRLSDAVNDMSREFRNGIRQNYGY